MLPTVEITKETRANLQAKALVNDINRHLAGVKDVLTNGRKKVEQRDAKFDAKGQLIAPAAPEQPAITPEDIKASLDEGTVERLDLMLGALTADPAKVTAALKALL